MERRWKLCLDFALSGIEVSQSLILLEVKSPISERASQPNLVIPLSRKHAEVNYYAGFRIMDSDLRRNRNMDMGLDGSENLSPLTFLSPFVIEETSHSGRPGLHEGGVMTHSFQLTDCRVFRPQSYRHRMVPRRSDTPA